VQISLVFLFLCEKLDFRQAGQVRTDTGWNTQYSQGHTPGLTFVTADAALAALRLDVTSSVFIRYHQMDAEMA
jgi:hypothetical protein